MSSFAPLCSLPAVLAASTVARSEPVQRRNAMKKLIAAVAAVVFVFTVCGMLAWASPAVGVTPTLIGRATYEPFKVKTEPESLADFEAKAKSPLDMVVRIHDYAVGGST